MLIFEFKYRQNFLNKEILGFTSLGISKGWAPLYQSDYLKINKHFKTETQNTIKLPLELTRSYFIPHCGVFHLTHMDGGRREVERKEGSETETIQGCRVVPR